MSDVWGDLERRRAELVPTPTAAPRGTWLDPTDDEVEAAQLGRGAGLNASADIARLAAANARTWPHLKPGDVVALARGGHGPDSPVAQEVSNRRVRRRSKKGLGWHTLGAPVRAAALAARTGARWTAEAADIVTPEAVEDVIGAGMSRADDVLRSVTRGALTAAAAPAEEVARQFRDVTQTVREEGVVSGLLFGGGMATPGEEAQTSAGIAVERLQAGERVDLGSGYLPAGDVRTEQARRAREYGTIGGSAITPGRLLGSVVTEPGTDAYRRLTGLIDFGVALADPTVVAGKASSAARASARMFTPEAAGAVAGRRRTVVPDRVAEWLDSPAGQKVVSAIAEEPDFDRLWRRSGKKLDVTDAWALSKMTDPAQVRAYLEPKLGIAYREKPAIGRVPFANPAIRRVRDARLLADLPGSSIDFDDPNGAVRTIDAFLRNANIRDPEVIARHTSAMAEAVVSGRLGKRYQAVTAAAKAVEDAIASHLPGERGRQMAREMTRLVVNREAELVRFNVDDIGANAWFPGVKVGADGLPAASPHLVVEGLGNKVHLPDARDIRRATSPFRRLLTNPAVEVPQMTLEHLQQKVWKAAVLIRGAYPVRVVGEEQVRMASAGLASLTKHPIQALGIIASDEGRLGRLLGGGRKDIDMLGELFAERAKLAPNPTELEKALYKGRVADPVGRARRLVARDRVLHAKDSPEYARAWAGELVTLRADPIGQRVALGGLKPGDATPNPLPGIDGIKDWLWHGAGRGLREELVAQAADPSTAPTTRALSDAYVDSVVGRLRTKAPTPELAAAVRTGALGDIPMRAGEDVNPDFVKALDGLREAGPSRVQGSRQVWVPGEQTDLSRRWDAATNWLFGMVMAKPSNYLSRNPTFRQAYWNRAPELMPFMEPKAQDTLLANAKAAKLTRAEMARLRELKAARSGDLTLAEADVVAKGYALEFTRDLLYDLSQRGQMFDQLRLLFPFGEAFREVMTRWARLLAERPHIARRGQQVVEGARGAGWFQRDETTGEEMFTYPGSQLVSDFLLGVPVPFKGRVAGLSMAASVLPGFGPVVQIPAAAILPERPEWEWVRSAVLPFGETDVEGGFVESLLPAWAQKFRIAAGAGSPAQDRLWANTVKDVETYLVSTGEHNTNSHEAIARLHATAVSKAKGLYVLRGFAQFFAPSAPSPKMLAADADGRLMVMRQLTEEFHNLQKPPEEGGVGYDNAVDAFLDRHGFEALLLMQGMSEGGARPTEAVADWAKRNPEAVKKYPSVYGFFAPAGGEFSIEFHQRQLRTGERRQLTPTEAVHRANARIAANAYRRAREQVAGRTDAAAKAWLAEVRDELIAEWPGWDPMPKDLGRTARTIRELERAVGDPALGRTEAGRGIASYLDARSQALEAVEQLTVRGRPLQRTALAKAKAARHLRDWLREVAAEIAAENPHFAPVWEQVFERELADDAEEADHAA